MDLFSIFKGGKYFDKHMAPKCDYCQFGRRAKDGNKVLCEKRGLVDCNYSCNKFIYSPLKRIPVKQLNFVGSLADEDIYIESAGDIAEKKELENPQKKDEPKKDAPKPAEAKQENKPAQAAPQANQPTAQNAPAQAVASQANQPAEQNSPAQAVAPQANQPAEQNAPAQAVAPQANQPTEQNAPAQASQPTEQNSPAQAAPSLDDLSALAEAAVKAAETSENKNVQ